MMTRLNRTHWLGMALALVAKFVCADVAVGPPRQ